MCIDPVDRGIELIGHGCAGKRDGPAGTFDKNLTVGIGEVAAKELLDRAVTLTPATDLTG